MAQNITRKELESLPHIKARIEQVEDRLLRLKERGPYDLHAVAFRESTGKTNENHSFDDDLARYMDEVSKYQKKLVKQKTKLIRLERRIQDFIDTLEDEKDKEIVSLRCIECLTFEEIAEIVHYSKSHIQRLYMKATECLK